MSTLPGAGIGMYAGKSLQKGDEVTPGMGDHIIPLVDVSINFEEGVEKPLFLWDEYTWNSRALRCDTLGVNEVNVCSPGFGAVANSFMDFLNVEEGYPILDTPNDLHRSKDPGAGAFTYYHSRITTTVETIEPGQEIFVSYGNSWYV